MKEASDNIERELKFVYDGSDEAVLTHLRALLPAGWLLVKFPPRTLLDVYFDTPDGLLCRDGASLRFRKRRINPGWSVNFKTRPEGESDYLARREVITSVKVDEALQYRDAAVPGLAYEFGRDYVRKLAQHDAQPAVLEPTVHLVSNRRCYTLRPGDIDDRQSNLVSVFFEEVTAIDVRDVDIDPLIRAGFLDYSTPIAAAAFSSAEIEADGSSIDAEAAAVAMMRSIGETLKTEFQVREERSNKYQKGAAALDLWSGRATQGQEVPDGRQVP